MEYHTNIFRQLYIRIRPKHTIKIFLNNSMLTMEKAISVHLLKALLIQPYTILLETLVHGMFSHHLLILNRAV